MQILTKSKYMIGRQCLRYLWILFHEPEKIPEKDESELYRLDEGTLIGELSTKSFPKGINLADLEFEENIQKTDRALEKGKPIFEAGLMAKNLFSRIDILEPVKGNKWDIIEVKASTRVKDEHILDVAFQKYCAEKKGLKIRNCYLMHLNKEYLRKGNINPKKLFVKIDISSEVDEELKDVKCHVDEMFKVIQSETCPSMDIGSHCNSPYSCLIEECWDFLPEKNVHHLIRGKEKAFELIEMGIYSIELIPETFKLTANQEIQRKCERTGKPHIDKEKIKDFLKTLEYPLYYLDFETFNTGVPRYDNSRPHQKIPFQFSLHIVEKEGSKAEHYSFLASGNKDPRKKFISELKKGLDKKGSIIVYNKTFEMTIIKELGESFPKHKPWAKKTIKRLVDLAIPFRKLYYYHPSQKGAAGLKVILPTLTGKNYNRLDISDGGTAMLEFLKITFEDVSDEEEKKVRENLEKYCGLDTEGMVWIVEKLEGIV